MMEGPVLVLDGEGRILRANEAVEKMSGQSAVRLAGRPAWEALFPDSRHEEIERLFDRVRRREETGAVEVEMPLADGGAARILWSHSVIRDLEGEVSFVLATGVDVTRLRALEEAAREREVAAAERKVREEALRTSEAKFSGIVEMASDAIVTVDQDHRILIFNRGAEQIFGYTEEEILGRPLNLLVPPGARSAHTGHIRRFAESPVAARRMAERSRISGVRKSGQEFPAEASILKLELDGERIFTVVLRDISDRTQREAHQRFLAEVGAALAATLELDGTLKSVARLSLEDLADFCIIDLVEEDGSVRRVESIHRDPGKAELAEALRQAPLDREKPHLMSRVLEAGEIRIMRSVSEEHLAELSQGEAHLETLSALAMGSYMTIPLAARERTLGALLLAREEGSEPYNEDHLELARELGLRAGLAVDNARLYQQARSALQARDDLVSVVSHDLGNPLQAIFIGLEALERNRSARGESGPGPEEYYLTAIRRSAEVMERLIQDLLEVRRVEAGHLTLERTATPLEPLVAKALEVLEPLAQVKSVELRNELAGVPLSAVLADPDRIQQVLSNLVGNAVKHTPEGGSVTLSGRLENGMVEIQVTDTGAGIPAEQLAHVFDRFWTGRPGRGSGIGLGLAIARGIVKAHGGQIQAESEEGRGSTFRFTLPLDEQSASQSSGHSSSESSGDSPGGAP